MNGEKFVIGERREVENGGIWGRGQITKDLVMETYWSFNVV